MIVSEEVFGKAFVSSSCKLNEMRKYKGLVVASISVEVIRDPS